MFGGGKKGKRVKKGGKEETPPSRFSHCSDLSKEREGTAGDSTKKGSLCGARRIYYRGRV